MKRLLFTLAVVPVAFCVFGQADSLAYAVPQNVVIRAQDFSDCHNAALMGDGEAMRRVAVCYQTGVGVGKDLEQAIIWYGKAARAGNVEADFDIGTLYRDGIGFPKDDSEAAYWFRKAARNGNVKAMVEIARQFLDGKGVQQDDRIAAEYFWRAGSRGSAEGQYGYACMLRDGRGLPKTRRKLWNGSRRRQDRAIRMHPFRLTI